MTRPESSTGGEGGRAVQVLGTPAVSVGGQSADLSALPARFLSALALRRGETLSHDEAIDAVWAGQPPTKPGEALRQHLMTLRSRIGEKDAISSSPIGFNLRAPTDLHDFDSGARQAEAAARIDDWPSVRQQAAGALSHWRGRPFEGCEEVQGVEAERARLEGLRLRLLELLSESYLAQGLAHQALEPLRALIVQEPANEPVSRLLIRALDAAGDKAGAMAEFSRLECQMQADFGTSPASTTVALVAEIDTAKRPSGVAQPRAGSPVPDLLTEHAPEIIGRGEELKQILNFVEQDALGRRLVLLEGPSGVGKTRLMLEAAQQLAKSGWVVLAARATPGKGSFRTVESAINLAEGVTSGDPFGSIRTELNRVFWPSTGGSPAEPEQRHHSARWREDFFRSLAHWSEAHKRVAILVDDLQWIDSDSLELFEYLWRAPGAGKIAFLATQRSVEADVQQTSARWAKAAVATDRALCLALEGLAASDLRRLMPTHDLDDGDLVAISGGNPLIANAYQRHLSDPRNGSLAKVADAWLAELGTRGAAVAQAAAILGADFDLRELRTAMTDQSTFEAGLRVCEHHGLIAIRAGGATASFIHGLIQREVRSRAAESEIAALHERLFHGCDHHQAQARAGHAVAAAGLLADRDVIEALGAAAEDAYARLGWSSASEYYALAIGRQDAAGALTAAEVGNLLVRAASVETHLNEDAANELLDRATALSRSTGDLRLAADIADVGVGTRILPDSTRLAFFEWALSLPAESHTVERAALQARLAVGLSSTARWPEAAGLAEQSCVGAGSLQAGPSRDAAFARALWSKCIAGQAGQAPDDHEEALQALTMHCTAIGATDFEVLGRMMTALHALEARDYERAESARHSVERLATDHSWPRFSAHACAMQASIALEQGHFDLAEEFSAKGQDYAMRGGYAEGHSYVRVGQEVCRRWHEGRLAEMAPLLEQAIAEPHPPVLACAAAAALADAGEADKALALLERTAGLDLQLLPRDNVFAGALAMATSVVFEVHDIRLATALRPHLAARAGRNLVAGAAAGLFGPAEAFLARTQAVLGETEAARANFSVALAACAERGAVLPAIRIKRDLARCEGKDELGRMQA